MINPRIEAVALATGSSWHWAELAVEALDRYDARDAERRAAARLAEATAQIKRMAEHQVHAQIECDAERDEARAAARDALDRLDKVRALCDAVDANPEGWGGAMVVSLSRTVRRAVDGES